MTLKVLHLAHGLIYGGIERVLVTLAAERGCAPAMEPEFALCFAARTSAELENTGAAVHLLGNTKVSRPWTVLRARARLARILAKRRPDVVIVHGSWAHGLFAGVVRRRGLPFVAVAHGFYGDGHWTERLAARHVPDLIIANSHATHASIARTFPRVRSVVSHYPVSQFEKGALAGGGRADIRTALGTSQDAVVALMASRLDSYKGHEVFLQAAASRESDQIEFWIAGGPQTESDGARYAHLRNLAAQYRVKDRVKFLGQRSDIAGLMAAADLFCQPNVGPEPFGIVFIEALRAELPVVTSDIGGGAEIVDASCGRLTPPGDASAVASAIGELAQDAALRASLGTAGRARAELLCDPAMRIPELASLLVDTIEAHRCLPGRVPA